MVGWERQQHFVLTDNTNTTSQVIALANGASNVRISEQGRDFDEFCAALEEVSGTLSVEMVRDGEGRCRKQRVE